MKRIYFIAYCTVILSFSSCTNWLDVQPKTNISENVLFEDEQGFIDALTGVYTKLGEASLYGREMTMGLFDVLAQNYDVSSNSHPYFEAGRYNYLDAATQSRVNQVWNSSYVAIANLNNLLTAIDKSDVRFTDGNYEKIKGEALGLRSFLHFDLLRAFGPIPELGLDKLAIPYITSFEMNVRPDLTGNEVIRECLHDLDQAIELLALDKSVNYGMADPFKSHTRNHFNYWAALALKARIGLYQNDKDMAYTSAMEIIENQKLFPFIDRESLLSSAPSRTFLSEQLFGAYVPNLRDINAGLFKGEAEGNALTNTESFVTQLFEGSSTDFRRVFLWKTDGSSMTLYPVKYWEDDIQTSTLNIKRVPLIKLAEVYYIAAESSENLQEKIGFLNTVRDNRGLDRLPEDLQAGMIENEILKEYRKEFYQEGQLFFYHKRKNTLRIPGSPKDLMESEYTFPIPDDEIEFKNTEDTTHEN